LWPCWSFGRFCLGTVKPAGGTRFSIFFGFVFRTKGGDLLPFPPRFPGVLFFFQEIFLFPQSPFFVFLSFPKTLDSIGVSFNFFFCSCLGQRLFPRFNHSCIFSIVFTLLSLLVTLSPGGKAFFSFFLRSFVSDGQQGLFPRGGPPIFLSGLPFLGVLSFVLDTLNPFPVSWCCDSATVFTPLRGFQVVAGTKFMFPPPPPPVIRDIPILFCFVFTCLQLTPSPFWARGAFSFFFWSELKGKRASLRGVRGVLTPVSPWGCRTFLPFLQQ